MSDFRKKRESLVLFTKEQLIGPGAFNKRYFFLEKWPVSEFAGKDLSSADSRAFDNKREILTEVPAYQYSSAILFPETRVRSASKQETRGNIVTDTPPPDDDAQDSNIGVDDDNINDTSSETLVSKQQNYPNSFGLSFVVNRTTDLQKDISMLMSFRKYKSVRKADAIRQRLGCWVPEYDLEIENAVKKYFDPLFGTVRIDNNLFVVIKQELEAEHLYDIDYKRLNTFLHENLINHLLDFFLEDLILINEKNGVKYYGIERDRKLEFYSIAATKSYIPGIDYADVVTVYTSNLIEFIQLELTEDVANYSRYKILIWHLEIYNQLRSIITDLKSVLKPKNASPIWESETFEDIVMQLPNYEGDNNVFRRNAIPIVHQDPATTDLNYSVQYILKGDEIFIKVVIVNKANITLLENEPPQLNKKNEANLKAYFGVELKIVENKKQILKQYNPPQLLDFDEEDNFNKLIYRNFFDYGEGYNTSVNWGKIDSELKFISTDFLPEQETPKVDFKPSKIINGKIKPRLQNDTTLSMRYLSTLSSANDDEILISLKGFISEYRLWITEKEMEIKNENDLDNKERRLLAKQLKACSNDDTRLNRNIDLLKRDVRAMAAFRVMNTAMFMQLHHSKGIERAKKLNDTGFRDFGNDANYYRTTTCIEGDYKWRSFQLAFILMNVDAFVRPNKGEIITKDIFGSGWPERNEIADLVWFPTGGGKTEAYLGIIAFAIAYRRFTNAAKGNGTAVLMRYTLRLLTLQQFQRATILICALEVIRKEHFPLPNNCSFGDERITIGLFVGSGSLPNKWRGEDKSMERELKKIANSIEIGKKISTSIPFTECPWCGEAIFIDQDLNNVSHKFGDTYGINDQLNICCNNNNCSFKGKGSKNRPTDETSFPLRLFDEDIYKFPPTLLFGTVDKFAALANKVSSSNSERDNDSSRLIGKRQSKSVLPPELIIQDELHLLLGPLGSAVGLFEKSIDHLCTYLSDGIKIKPKIITSTATTRNTDKQIFALFNRRSEIFPKQGILCDDSFFAYYERSEERVEEYTSNRKYLGILPVGKTQVWMQLRVVSITLCHRLKFLKENYSNDEIFETPDSLDDLKEVFDYYHTVLSYFNSLKDVGKTQSQLSHYLPGDVNFVTKNTIPWSFLDGLMRNESEIDYSELTGRLSGEEVKTNLSNIERKWTLLNFEDGKNKLNINNPPEFVIATNMISVGIDVSRFNTMVISSMPRNVAEYIQASSRVARRKEGIVFTIHHPFRSRDISHYQKFKEFHEKFYSYVEPISVTPFANKALDRYFAMFLSVMIRHNKELGLMNNKDANLLTENKILSIKSLVMQEINEVAKNAYELEKYLVNRDAGVISSIDGIISEDEVADVESKLNRLIENWFDRLHGSEPIIDLEYRSSDGKINSLFTTVSDDDYPTHWKVGYSLREIDPSVVIKTVQQ
jgi:hypothetical protein